MYVGILHVCSAIRHTMFCYGYIGREYNILYTYRQGIDLIKWLNFSSASERSDSSKFKVQSSKFKVQSSKFNTN